MSTIIKATDRNAAIQRVAFNFDDMTAKANEYLEQVRAEAGRIVAEARKEAAAIRKQAEAEGRKAGQKMVEQMVQQQLAQQLNTLMPALRQVIQNIHHAKQAWLSHWEKSAVHLCASMAARVIRRELAHAPEVTVTLVREALKLSAGSSQLRIHLHPADHQALAPQLESLLGEFSSLGGVEIVADPEITRGGCRVETRFGVIDQQVESQLARIEEELT